jgi:hypothetical protein
MKLKGGQMSEITRTFLLFKCSRKQKILKSALENASQQVHIAKKIKIKMLECEVGRKRKNAKTGAKIIATGHTGVAYFFSTCTYRCTQSIDMMVLRIEHKRINKTTKKRERIYRKPENIIIALKLWGCTTLSL